MKRSSKRQKLTPGPDYDGDSQMASSPESSLPGTRTPIATNPAYGNTSTPARTATGMGELSPPGSQQQAHKTSAGRTTSGGGGVELAAATGKQRQSQQRLPGETWMNKRAEDDYHRAMESVVDKDFSLSKLADILRLQLSCLGWLLEANCIQRNSEIRLMSGICWKRCHKSEIDLISTMLNQINHP